MILTKKQEEGLQIAIQRFRNREKYTVIAGYAGVGKSELVRFIVNALYMEGVSEEDIAFCSYTGKAALVLQQKGNKNAMTLHKLLYDSKPKADGTFIHTPKLCLNYRIIIIDECSMMPKTMMALLFKYPVYCIFCGDPFQLSPVDKNANNGLLDHPHIFLDEIMRQAAENDIIQLSMQIREQNTLQPFKGHDAVVIRQKDLNTGVLQWGDQILCATNATRKGINSTMRRLLKRGAEPEDGDRVICLRNYDQYGSTYGNFLVNGVTGILQHPFPGFVTFPRYLCSPNQIKTIRGVFIGDDGDNYGELSMDYNEIQTGETSFDAPTLYKLRRNKKSKSLIPLEFTYGYAITVWKAQGSEWNKIVLIEEKFPFDKLEHLRYLYTGITRARDKVVVVLKD